MKLYKPKNNYEKLALDFEMETVKRATITKHARDRYKEDFQIFNQYGIEVDIGINTIEKSIQNIKKVTKVKPDLYIARTYFWFFFYRVSAKSIVTCMHKDSPRRKDKKIIY